MKEELETTLLPKYETVLQELQHEKRYFDEHIRLHSAREEKRLHDQKQSDAAATRQVGDLFKKH